MPALTTSTPTVPTALRLHLTWVAVIGPHDRQAHTYPRLGVLGQAAPLLLLATFCNERIGEMRHRLHGARRAS